VRASELPLSCPPQEFETAVSLSLSLDYLNNLFTRLDPQRQQLVRQTVDFWHDTFQWELTEKGTVNYLGYEMHYRKGSDHYCGVRGIALDWKDENDLWKYIVNSFVHANQPPPRAEIEAYLTGQLSAYIENCLYCCEPCPWAISFHETRKLLGTKLRFRHWPIEACDESMSDRIHAAVAEQFAEYLATPDDLYGYKVVKSPPPGECEPDPEWAIKRAYLCAMR
jgi:hypothetical protein